MLLIIFLLSFLNFTNSAEYLEVIEIKGTVLLDGKDTLRKNDRFYEGNFIKILDNSKIEIKTSEERTIIIGTPGIHSGAKIKMKIGLSYVNIDPKLEKYISQSIIEAEEYLQANDFKYTLYELGAEMHEEEYGSYKLFSPRNSRFSDILYFKFLIYGYVVNEFNFIFKDSKENIVLDTIFYDITEIFKLSNYIDINDTEYTYSIKYKNKEITGYKITRNDENLRNKIKKIEEYLISKLDFDYCISHIILAKFFESYNMNSEAMFYYERAMHKNPTVSEYKYLYYRFLMSMGVKGSPNGMEF